MFLVVECRIQVYFPEEVQNSKLFSSLDILRQGLIDGFFLRLHAAQTHGFAQERFIQFYVGCHVRSLAQKGERSITLMDDKVGLGVNRCLNRLALLLADVPSFTHNRTLSAQIVPVGPVETLRNLFADAVVALRDLIMFRVQPLQYRRVTQEVTRSGLPFE